MTITKIISTDQPTTSNVETMAEINTALLIIDMQNVFESMVTSAISEIEDLHTFFEMSMQSIIFTQHGHSDDELIAPYTNQLVKRWGPDGSIRKGSQHWELLPVMQKLVRDHPVVDKNTYDSFINSNLSALLEERHIARVIVCGVMTDCCCDTTARSAFNRGYETWLVSDACGSASQRQHEAGLSGFEFACDNVMTTAEAIERLQRDQT